jgi:hypothetical protein
VGLGLKFNPLKKGQVCGINFVGRKISPLLGEFKVSEISKMAGVCNSP